LKSELRIFISHRLPVNLVLSIPGRLNVETQAVRYSSTVGTMDLAYRLPLSPASIQICTLVGIQSLLLDTGSWVATIMIGKSV
jgi:hypothetical protein